MIKPYYQDDHCTIYHGDCREVLPSLGPVDLVLTDPPYGLTDWNNRGTNSGGPFDSEATQRWDVRPSAETIALVLAAGKMAIFWGGNHLADTLGASKQFFVWDKGIRGMHFNDCELAWCSEFRQACRVFNFPAARNNQKQHPTQKPVELFTWCIYMADKAQRCKTILDPFMGSGTTLRAAKDLGRKAIGIELEEKYCEIAAKRLRQEVLPFAAA